MRGGPHPSAASSPLPVNSVKRTAPPSAGAPRRNAISVARTALAPLYALLVGEFRPGKVVARVESMEALLVPEELLVGQEMEWDAVDVGQPLKAGEPGHLLVT